MPHQTRGVNKHGNATKNSRRGNGGCPCLTKNRTSNSTKYNTVCCTCGGVRHVNRIVKEKDLKKYIKKQDFSIN
ncbi:MAG: hypothetical protein Edafosvirus1_2 [Edafosvirus sp.]|uniref:Uncharacterized protein n=1 Tax=Edafosvirus sp. TaxID=2487765 RepID=A0A3G4ZUJ9_9VIRU|nr:MAG: hypothetical protein Edafosvirus1_2 [Edafosvirus sp.]